MLRLLLFFICLGPALAQARDGFVRHEAGGSINSARLTRSAKVKVSCDDKDGESRQSNSSTNKESANNDFFSDSGKPSIKNQSVGAFVPVGESATLSVVALGQNPLTYRWYRGGKLLAGASQEKYTISNPVLADNGASFVCIVSNALGADTTSAMVLKVVQGQRPVVRILHPFTNDTYQAGGVIAYAGEALNASKQLLANAKLTWWIDFHHDNNVDPVLEPTTGPASGIYKVPRVGETSTKVWYRFHFMATDVSGLTAETWVDIKPQISLVTINSKPAVAQLTVDGNPYSTELTFPAVVGTLRTFSVKPYLSTPAGFYKFSGWSNGQSSTIMMYEVPPANASVTINYTALPSPGGNGLLAEYYSDRSDFTIAGQPALTRVDTTIDYEWGYESPSSKVSRDFFLVRWSGKFQVPFSDTFTFSTESDDGVRLWVNNRLVVDKWEPQYATEWNTEMDLKAGQTYTIRLEYFDKQATALVHLRWSSPQFDKATICKPQLFAGQFTLVTASEPVVDAGLTLFPQPAHDHLTVRYIAPRSGPAQIEVTDLLGRRVYQQPVRVVSGTNEYEIPVADWPGGLYHLAVHPADQSAVFRRMLVR